MNEEGAYLPTYGTEERKKDDDEYEYKYEKGKK